MISFLLHASFRASTYLALSTLCFASLSAQAGETTNSIGIKMVDIPAGSFVMGSCPQDKKSAFLGKSSCSNPDPGVTANNYQKPPIFMVNFFLHRNCPRMLGTKA